jgi:hypothetical protein
VGAAVTAGTSPSSVTVDASGQFAYVANFGSGNVSTYAINATTGALTEVGTAVAAGDTPGSIITLGELVDVEVIIYRIGDTGPAGGIVFYVTALGNHGLEAAPGDLNGDAGAPWGCVGTLTGADGLTIGTGAQNTTDILAECTVPGIAAKLADDYSFNGFDDWFLPSRNELNEMYINKDVVGGFLSIYYWSSSESFSSTARGQNFNFYGTPNNFLKSNELRVRAVRAF